MKLITPCLTYFLILLFFTTKAQNQKLAAKIQGRVIEKNEKVVSSTLTLFKDGDSTFKKSMATDDKGKYLFANLSSGKYTVMVTATGYVNILFYVTINENSLIINKDFTLIPATQELKAVHIIRKKPLIERLNNKTVMNVENSGITTGNTLLEILAKIPGVNIDQNGQISIKGKSGVNVLIDGKSTYLSAAQLATHLRSFSGSSIKSIELITNPSAKYDAEGNAGIINIKLKKNSSYGTNGSLDLGYGYGNAPKTDAGISLNHRTGKINIFGNYTNNFNRHKEDLDIFRTNQDADEKTFFHQKNIQTNTSNDNNYKVGVDYFINEKNTIGFLTSGYFNNGSTKSEGSTYIGKSFSQIDSIVMANNPAKNKYKNQAYNINYKSVIDTLGQEFSVDLDYAKYQSEEQTTYTNHFTYANSLIQKAPAIFRNATPSTVKIWAAKIDYAYPIATKTKLELGLKSSFVSTDNDFRFENLIGTNWQNDRGKSNHFIYDEYVNAIYGTLKHSFNTTNIEIGLRVEQTNSKGNSINEHKSVKRGYFDFFPNIAINQTVSANSELGLSYNKRIDRPDYKSLNPFVYFVDLYTFSQGNPFLNPQYTTAFQLSYSYQKSLNVSLGYSITNDLITDVFLADTEQKTLYQTAQNLTKQYSYDLTIGAPTSITKYWEMDNTLTLTHNQTMATVIGDEQYNRNKFSYTINTNHNFTISSSTSAELSGDYTSSQIYGTFAIKPYYGIDLDLKKSLLNNKFNLKFAINDVFNTRKIKVSSAVPSLDYRLIQKLESRVFRVSLNYIFGNSNIKSSRERKTSVSDEEARIK